jgi:hypothetical protein
MLGGDGGGVMPKRKKGFYSAAEIDASPQLAAELLTYGNECVDIDEQIQTLREQKADLFERMRDSSFDPAHARAWSAEKLKDEEKEALKREKRTEAELIVETLAATETAKGRAGARARSEAKAARQEKTSHDPETGEIQEPTVSLDGKGSMPLGQFMTVANALESPIGRAVAAGFIAGAKLDQHKGEPPQAERPPLRRIEPRTPEPAPDMPDLPSFLDRRNQQEAAAE